MSEEPNAGTEPEGEALPEHLHSSEAIERAVRGIEAWYAKHFHAAAVAGRTPISADDKAALLQHVAEAVAPAAKE
jgi:hypothetical protein